MTIGDIYRTGSTVIVNHKGEHVDLSKLIADEVSKAIDIQINDLVSAKMQEIAEIISDTINGRLDISI